MTYQRIYHEFWRGRTGRALAAEDAFVRCVAFYLCTCQSANSEGLYRIPMPDVAYDVGHGMTEDEARAAFGRLMAMDFLHYDVESEFVWVKRMAFFQFQPLPLQDTDKRIKGIDRWYRGCGANAFLGDWWDAYAGPHALNLTVERRENGSGPLVALSRHRHTKALPAVTVEAEPVVPILPPPALAVARVYEAPSEELALLPDPEKHTGPQGFDEDFWGPYPKKRARPRCEQEWKRQKIGPQDRAIMRAKLADPLTYWPEWAQDKILDPINFLKDRRWLDEAAPVRMPVSQRSQDTMRKTETIRQMMQKSLTDGASHG